jgi:glycine dehydrogenase subunit 1
MRYIPVSCDQREAMLRAVGVSDVDELFADIPDAARLGRPLDLPDGMSEPDLSEHLKTLAARNLDADRLVSFLGAGCYDHFVPAIVDAMISKPEFFTAYTPYQPEVSQGTLQAIYEFQTMIAELTGMDVANASMYDGATALVEAGLMAARATKRHRVVVSGAVHPEWRSTLATYVLSGTLAVEECASAGGVTDLDLLAATVDGTTAAVLVSQPTFYGGLEDLDGIARITHEAGALLVVAANPLLLGVLEPPSAYGADIVVGEGQPLGIPMSGGGPGFGFFACRESFLRQMPGRIVGRTADVDGRDGFVLTMQTREQHIRREKATSNICSNHALAALAGSVYLASVGAEGLAGIARSCVAKAHYLRERLIATGRFSAPWDGPFAHEFALRYDGDVPSMQTAMLGRGYLAGYAVGSMERKDPGVASDDAGALVIFAATERRTRAQIDSFADEVASL